MTWYYVPSTCAPVTEALSSPCDSPASPPEPWLTLSGTPTQRPLSWPGWKRRTWIKRLSGLTSPPSTVQCGVDEWISSLPASPANPSPQRDNSVELTTSVGSGLPSDGSSVKWDPDSCSWRTSPSLFDSGYLTSSPTLPSSGSMRNGVCSQRPRLAHRTSVSGSGYWGTPVATDAKGSGGAELGTNVTLTDAAVRLWPTPQAADGHKIGSMTPKTAARQAAKGHQEMLAGSIHTASGPQGATTTTDGTDGPQRVDLNPRFVEALMGVPQNWLTPSTSVETDSYRRWLQLHSLSSPADSVST